VIKLGAFGDVVQAFHAAAAIRTHHRGAHVTLLTTAPFMALGLASPWFDVVRVDARGRWWDAPAAWRVVKALRGHDLVYDLQTSKRSCRYYSLAGRPPWSGIARGCSLPHANPLRDSMHTLERQREQLRLAGIRRFPIPDLSWLVRQGSLHGLTRPYAMLIPGAAGQNGAKRWPAVRYAALAQGLAAQGLTPVVIGGAAEAAAGACIRSACPSAIDLTGRTTMFDIAAIAARARLAIGNDTGPLHLAASVGAPCIVLFSVASVPEQSAPRGPAGEWPTVLSSPSLADLSVKSVLAAAMNKLQRHQLVSG